MGASVDVDADVAVGVDGDDDGVGDGLPVGEVEVGDVGATGGAGVDGDVTAFVADLAVDGGDVERHRRHAAGRDVAGAEDAEGERGAAVGAVADLGGADATGVVAGVGHTSRRDRGEGVVWLDDDGDLRGNGSARILGLHCEGEGARRKRCSAQGAVAVGVDSGG